LEGPLPHLPTAQDRGEERERRDKGRGKYAHSLGLEKKMVEENLEIVKQG
jgi:hypothetical protein